MQIQMWNTRLNDSNDDDGLPNDIGKLVCSNLVLVRIYSNDFQSGGRASLCEDMYGERGAGAGGGYYSGRPRIPITRSTESFAQSPEKVLEASYELSLLIAKAKKAILWERHSSNVGMLSDTH
ncbi:hypothetical protein EVAR_27885_1 [Eumeta japonica]|uniref:Uncharacterized protein n=1 Tax=Eumeta variegata TaxID=151549 RepID=A0A4C1UUU6_EUMVA|nr:hypothetical protein EVAR_27885_1 [Eumeta japonica]